MNQGRKDPILHDDLEDLIDGVASGSISFYDERFQSMLNEDDDFLVIAFNRLLSPDLPRERHDDLEGKILYYLNEKGWTGRDIWNCFYFSPCLHFRLVAEIDKWFDGPDEQLFMELFSYLKDEEYLSHVGRQDSEEKQLWLIKRYASSSPGITDFIKWDVFDTSSPEMKEEVLCFLLEEYDPGEKGDKLEDIILSLLKSGFVSDMPLGGIQLRKLREWAESRPDVYEYWKAGLWEAYDTHERAKMMASHIDAIRSNSEHLSQLYRLLKLENSSSPLFREAQKELYSVFTQLFYDLQQ